MADKKKKKTAGRTMFKLTEAQADKWLDGYAKRLGVKVGEAKHKVLTLGITRQMSLEKYNGGATPKAKAKPKTKSAKPAAGKVVKKKAAKAKKPAAAKKKTARKAKPAEAPKLDT